MDCTKISGKFTIKLAKFMFGLAIDLQYLLPGADKARSFKLDPKKRDLTIIAIRKVSTDILSRCSMRGSVRP